MRISDWSSDVCSSESSSVLRVEALFEPQGKPCRHKNSFLNGMGNGLIDCTGSIAKPPGQRIIGNDAQSHLVRHEDQRAASGPDCWHELLCLLRNVPLGKQEV